ncbi:MAG: 30S ribosomal protein S16 [Candidatus Berkelbacteria bacterium]|nr:30S ribosomal protein S16 [Candidatus Berkelbacteria bacterium]
MLKIRLTRVGKNNTPIYRLVVAEKTRAVKRENLEILGLFNPCDKINRFSADKERVLYWIGRGAQPSDTANNLLCDAGILAKDKKIKNVFGRPEKKKDKGKLGEVKGGKVEEVADEKTAGESPAEENDEATVAEAEIAETEESEKPAEEAIEKETLTAENTEEKPETEAIEAEKNSDESEKVELEEIKQE